MEHTTADIEIIGAKPQVVVKVEQGISPDPFTKIRNQTLDLNAIDLKSLQISPKTKVKIEVIDKQTSPIKNEDLKLEK